MAVLEHSLRQNIDNLIIRAPEVAFSFTWLLARWDRAAPSASPGSEGQEISHKGLISSHIDLSSEFSIHQLDACVFFPCILCLLPLILKLLASRLLHLFSMHTSTLLAFGLLALAPLINGHDIASDALARRHVVSRALLLHFCIMLTLLGWWCKRDGPLHRHRLRVP